MGEIMGKIVGLLQNWIILCPMSKKENLKNFITGLKRLANKPEMLQ